MRIYHNMADSRFAPSQLVTALLYNDVSHWLGPSLESALSSALSQYLNQCRFVGNYAIDNISKWVFNNITALLTGVNLF